VVTAAAASSRRLLLEQAAVAAAEAWAGLCMHTLRAEGRAVAGGWPGTMSEARGWARAKLAVKGMTPTHDELEWLVRTTYALARDTWRAGAGKDDQDQVDLEAG
jgi:hypothetical protein